MLVELSSSAFAAGQPIPRRYSCAGEDLSPPLAWRAVPADAVSLALIVDDPDAPGRTFTHWLAWGINPDAGGLGEGERARREGLMTSGRPATAGRVRRVAMDRTDTSFASTRSRPSPRCPRTQAARSSSAHSRTTSSPSPSLSAPISGESADFPQEPCIESLRSCAQPQPRAAPRTPPAGRRRDLRGPRGYSVVCSTTTV
jgi:Raf kinase inhibitor-like YbhB/YbcL family protein